MHLSFAYNSNLSLSTSILSIASLSYIGYLTSPFDVNLESFIFTNAYDLLHVLLLGFEDLIFYFKRSYLIFSLGELDTHILSLIFSLILRWNYIQ